MKRIGLFIFALVLTIGVAFAASENETARNYTLELIKCQKQCCNTYNGSWTSDREGCYITNDSDGSRYRGFAQCDNDCGVTAAVPALKLCGSGAILLAVVGCVFAGSISRRE